MRTFGAVNALFEARSLPVSERSGSRFAEVLGSDFFVDPRWMFLESLGNTRNLRAKPAFPGKPVDGPYPFTASGARQGSDAPQLNFFLRSFAALPEKTLRLSVSDMPSAFSASIAGLIGPSGGSVGNTTLSAPKNSSPQRSACPPPPNIAVSAE